MVYFWDSVEFGGRVHDNVALAKSKVLSRQRSHMSVILEMNSCKTHCFVNLNHCYALLERKRIAKSF